MGLTPEGLSGLPPAGLEDNGTGSGSGVLRASPGGREEVGVSFLTGENCLIVCLSSSPLILL